MRAANYWEQFLSTGKIDDYLAYRSVYGKEDPVVSEPPARPGGDEGVSKGAATDQCYRDHFKSGTGWRV